MVLIARRFLKGGRLVMVEKCGGRASRSIMLLHALHRPLQMAAKGFNIDLRSMMYF